MVRSERLRKERRAAEGLLRKRLRDRDPQRYATGEMKKAILLRDNFRCRYCGADLRNQKRWIDHVIPWSRGGPTQPSNLVAVCGPCNGAKGARMDVRPRHLDNGYGGPVRKLSKAAYRHALRASPPPDLSLYESVVSAECIHRRSPNCSRVTCLEERLFHNGIAADYRNAMQHLESI